jgi:hypothetical protein
VASGMLPAWIALVLNPYSRSTMVLTLTRAPRASGVRA